MRHILEPAADAALAAVVRRLPLLGFDFDGTLAPIVRNPERARISQCVSGKLRRLSQRLPVAIVSGRSADDVKRRLDFEPYCVIGNHGADMGGTPAEPHANQSLDCVRELLARHAVDLSRAGVTIEDKALSIALHYRLSRQPALAMNLIRDVLDPLRSDCRVFSGKMVENVMPAGAPDKAEAMHRLVRLCGAACAVFVGDDVNDEPVFACAPDDWLGIRIGRDDPKSRADYFLDNHSEIGMLLDRLLVHSSQEHC